MNDSETTARDDFAVLGDLAPGQVRVRFPPSPTGNLHVGNVRSALFNWVFARHYGGTFVLRVEDTDAGRNLEESYQGLYDSLSWLGLNWDEGPLVGGPYGPYIQTERGDIYRRGRRQAARGQAGVSMLLHPGGDRGAGGGSADGRAVGLRRVLPQPQRAADLGIGCAVGSVGGTDAGTRCRYCLRRPGPWASARLRPRTCPTYVIVRSNGEPLYTLVNPLDDSLMEITHVLRGEDLLPSTPRQIVLYDALSQIGVGSGRTPTFGHLPTVLGEGNRRLSKRDKGSGLAEYQQKGYLPEALLNYLALLGWAIAEDRDVFAIAEMVEAFDIRRVNANPARFDARKCEAINAAHIRLLPADELTANLIPFFAAAGLIGEPARPEEHDRLAAATPLIQERINTLSEAVSLLAFLFLPDDKITIAADAGLSADSIPTLRAAYDALTAVPEFDHASVEAALRTALVQDLGLKPRLAFGPVRAAITGSRISPPLFESIELLGRASTLARIAAALALLGEPEIAGSSPGRGDTRAVTPEH